METILGIVTIIVLSLLGTHKSFNRLPLLGSVNVFFLTGTEFLIVGVLLGPLFTGMISTEVLNGLYTFVGLGLGWLGMLFGLQFDLKRIIRIPKEYISAAFLQAAVSFLILFAGSYLFFTRIITTAESPVVSSLLIASIGSCSSQTALGIIASEKKYRRSKTLRILRFMSGLGDIPGLLVFGLLFGFLHTVPPTGIAVFPALQWTVLTAGLGAVFGWLLIFLLRLNINRDERLLFAFGIVLFSGGLAAFLRLSPLLVNFISGIIIANFTRRHHLLDDLFSAAEKPIYLVLLVLAGSMWPAEPLMAFGAAGLFVLVRMAAKSAGGLITARTLRHEGFPPTLGLGLQNQGGMALAMIVSFQTLYGNLLVPGMVTTIIGAIIVSELIGQRLIYSVISREAAE